jgi:hypothetical protein
MHTTSDYFQFFSYSGGLETKASFIIDDDFNESMDSMVVDQAFGFGTKYINIKGINGLQKISKVSRFEEIFKATHQ